MRSLWRRRNAVSELRWNPLLGEWVATATHRQERTFLPPANLCTLCPTKEGGFPTEVPESDYDIVVFENRFPSLQSSPPPPAVEGTDLYPVRPAKGVCEVVLYTPHHAGTLRDEPVEQIYKLVQVWTERFAALGALEFVHALSSSRIKARASASRSITRTGRYTRSRSSRLTWRASLSSRARIMSARAAA